MKKLLLFSLLFFAVTTFAQEQQQAAVKSTIDLFFKSMHAKDTLGLKKVCSDKMILQSIAETAKGSSFSDESTKDFFNSIASIPDAFHIEERLLDYKIEIDGELAHAWTPYEFYINEKFSHKGVNSFTLYYENNAWKIISIIDTRRKK
jgi:hypothetical protein